MIVVAFLFLLAKQFPVAPHLAEDAGIRPAVRLPAASKAASKQLEEMRQRNRRGERPFRNGFARSFPRPISVHLTASTASNKKGQPLAGGIAARSDRGVVWSALFKVDHASKLRLHLEEVRLPAGAVLWVYGKGEAPAGFDQALLDPKQSLWTPSTKGDTIYFEVEIPSGDKASFVIREVMELFPIRAVR